MSNFVELPRSIIADQNLKAMEALARGAPAGALVEVGVYRGGSALRLYAIALEQQRELHLFDTFTGIPFKDPDDKHEVGEFADEVSVGLLRTVMPQAHLHVGVYPTDTHIHTPANIAFIHCDCDQYRSYRAVIDLMWPFVVPGGVLLFDDYPYLKGAKRAVEETWSIDQLEKTTAGRYFVRKIPV